MNVYIEELVKQYKRDNNIEGRDCPEKIRTKFQEVDKELLNFKTRKMCHMEQVNFSSVIYEKFKSFNINTSKSKLDNLIRIKFKKGIEVKFRVEREDNRYSKFIKEKFTNHF